MSLTKVEQAICQFVVQQLLDHGDVTRRQALLKQFKASLGDALRKLVDRAVLRAVEQVYNQETYLPRAAAFYYCGQPTILELAQKSTDTVFKILLILYERELDKEPQDQRQFFVSSADVETEAHSLGIEIDQQMIRLGLYFADELSVLSPLRRDEKQVFPASSGVTEHIYSVMNDGGPWDLLIKRSRSNVENYPYGRSLERIAEDHQAIEPLDIEALTKDVSDSFASSNDAEDRKFAQLVVKEARKSISEDGRVHPKVGVVVVKDGRVLATAHRGEIPQGHAEFIALEKKLADVSLSGSTVYTTLEPCTSRNHPKIPCANRLVERKVARVVIGMLDPDDRISGRGQRTLRKAGIATELFPHDLMAEVEELNRDFIRDRESYENHSLDANVVAKQPIRKADLRIHSFEKSCFTLVMNSSHNGQLLGMHVNLDLAVENRGNKGATIQRYDLYVHETHKTYQDIPPNLGMLNIQGRHCLRHIGNESRITSDGLIRLQPETMTPRGFLPFFPLDAPILVNGPVHCRLTLTDTDGDSVSREFELREV